MSLSFDNDLRTHFLVCFIEDLPQEIRKAHLAWMPDTDGRKRTIDELNLQQLGVNIFGQSNDSSTRNGWIYFRGNLLSGYYPKSVQRK